MARIQLTPNLQRHISLQSVEVKGITLREALNDLFSCHPALASYIVDDQGILRKHVNIFVDNVAIKDRRHFSEPINKDSEIYLLQALSGGKQREV